MNRLKQLGKDSIIYGIGGILAKSISFFLLPVYTRIFTPAEFGTIEMMVTIVGLLTALLVMGMDSAQSFYFFEQKKNGIQQQKNVITAILQWRLIWGSGIVIFSGFLAPFLNVWFFEGELTLACFAVSFSGALFSTIMGQSVEIFRLLYRPWSFIGITVIYSFLAAGTILLFVLVLDQGFFGYFLGTALADFFIACLGWYLIREYLDMHHLHYEWWPRLIRFGAPLLPAGLSYFIMSATDRFFIQHYYGAYEVGIYAVGAKVALMMAIVIETFRKAWWPIAMDVMQGDDGPEVFKMVSQLFMGVGVAAVVYLTFLSPWLVDFLAAPVYRDAWVIVGLLAWESLFYGFYMIASAGIWKTEKTYLTMYLMLGAAAFNVLLNVVFVPLWGIVGASLATAITFFLWVVATLIVSERLWRIGFPFDMFMMQICVGAIVVFFIINERLSPSNMSDVLVVHLIVIGLLCSSLNRERWRNILYGVNSK